MDKIILLSVYYYNLIYSMIITIKYEYTSIYIISLSVIYGTCNCNDHWSMTDIVFTFCSDV